jgi:hypothetical protein
LTSATFAVLGNQPVAENKENVVSSSESPERRPIISTRQARGGVTGHNVRFVLGLSVAAVVIVFCYYLVRLFRLKQINCEAD